MLSDEEQSYLDLLEQYTFEIIPKNLGISESFFLKLNSFGRMFYVERTFWRITILIRLNVKFYWAYF